MQNNTRVAILGASSKAERFSNKAQQMLTQHDYEVVPVSVKESHILGVPCVADLADITQPIDTVTLYVGPARLAPLLEDIVALAPKRVIFNPGTEDSAAETRLEAVGITTVRACTLVLLRGGKF